MGSGNAHYLLHGLAGTSTQVLRVELRCNGGGCPSGGGSYQVRAELVNTGSTLRSTQGKLWSATSWVVLSDAVHTLARRNASSRQAEA
jgi:hypothetical protein